MDFGLFERFVRRGELTIVDHKDRRRVFGAGEPSATWHLRTPFVLGKILRNPELNLGETYLNGEWDVAEGTTLHALLTLLRINLEPQLRSDGWHRRLASALVSWNSLAASRRNASHHYDMDEPLFRACLDREMHYSCAYFREPDISLEAAQQAKANHIAAKLSLQPGQKVLDIGSGWGSLALHLAEHFGVSVVGITLSSEQLRVAREAAAARGLSDKVQFHLEDYRNHHATYDRIVSVGMFEHVGRRNFRRFFGAVKALLAPDGIALVHTIASEGRPAPTNAWIRRHVFPGGYIPAMSDVANAVERTGLSSADVEVLRGHYALTLKEWHRRFQNERASFAASKGERFCRMWEFYLVVSQTAFEVGDLVVHHWLLAKDKFSVPTTRDYQYESESFESSAKVANHSLRSIAASRNEPNREQDG
tara:strand:- start:1798 stop:3060 length:1263 start_codon:yes stop_codon:yes gene_type:complete